MTKYIYWVEGQPKVTCWSTTPQIYDMICLQHLGHFRPSFVILWLGFAGEQLIPTVITHTNSPPRRKYGPIVGYTNANVVVNTAAVTVKAMEAKGIEVSFSGASSVSPSSLVPYSSSQVSIFSLRSSVAVFLFFFL